MINLTLANEVVFPPQGPPVKTILYTGAGGATEFNSAVDKSPKSCGIAPLEFERRRRVDSCVTPNWDGTDMDVRLVALMETYASAMLLGLGGVDMMML